MSATICASGLAAADRADVVAHHLDRHLQGVLVAEDVVHRPSPPPGSCRRPRRRPVAGARLVVGGHHHERPQPRRDAWRARMAGTLLEESLADLRSGAVEATASPPPGHLRSRWWKRAGRADLDGVGLHRLVTAHEPSELGLGERAGAPGRQPGPEDVGDLHGRRSLADRAVLAGRAPEVRGGTQQLRVGVADVLAREPALRQPGPTPSRSNRYSTTAPGLEVVARCGSPPKPLPGPRPPDIEAVT